MGEAQIILSHSPESGLVAIASGEQYPWARTTLAATLSRLAGTRDRCRGPCSPRSSTAVLRRRKAALGRPSRLGRSNGEIFRRQALVSAPHRRPVLPVADPLHAARPAHRSH
ncbi:hypothetical protein QA995_37825 [Streptomyces scabiei]|uniref:Uncharacterized protein n=3 Tax=Streptomyces TaxID=1883 RepID=A0ABW9IP60_STRGJ|nr:MULTISPECIES: hypothetical protein [Streptomyces]MDX3170356.1 hypothetical protein [Streptomyces scabiei]MDX3550419.1 hypothetical protein [Streptomyces europaeiscabiei]MDX3699021.1 hypothetical protein [Streptomyces europaeiscabiei]